MTYQLVALDLDGTVVDHDLVIHPDVRETIAAAQARGVHVTLATGRMYGAAVPFAHALDIQTPIICYQGALIRHPKSGEVLYHVTMPPDLAAAAVRVLLAADVFVIAYIDERHCIAARRPELDRYEAFHPEGVEIVVEPDLAGLVATTPPTKLLFVAEPPVVESELARLVARFGESLAIVRSHAIFGELTAPRVSKGDALAALAARLGVVRDAVLAIGDQENDLSMIAWAGLGLAMGNAVPAVRALAREVLPPVSEAGVAYALRRYVLDGACQEPIRVTH
ncbi:MAG: HAD family phosphatase [Chloroflexi bacterium]|nr:HAD family phosphatase [Chloroflexota bacterium]